MFFVTPPLYHRPDEPDRDDRPFPALALILAMGCVMCVASMYRSWHTLTPLQRQSIVEDFQKNGVFNVLTSIGPFERPISSVRLTDLSTAHDHCGPECPESKSH